jgi:mRNA interferase RelE/StbE
VYSVEIRRSAKKELDVLPLRVQHRCYDALLFLAHNPFSEVLHIKKLRGALSLYRLRIGDYRIVYEVNGDVLTVTVIKVGHRSEVYR